MAASTHAEPHSLPIAEINTTPLIDVMLVLLIMFVITIPVANHALQIDLPTTPGPVRHPILPVNRITLASDNTLAWNGQPIRLAELSTLLAAVTHARPQPEVQFAPDAQAPYGTAAEVVRSIKLSGVTSFGFVGNERFGSFGKAAPTNRP